MKERLNLTIDAGLLNAIKAYALNKETSVSELVENYFKTVTRPIKRKNIVELVDKLDKPVLDEGIDLKELFYKEQGKKYGF